MASKNFSVFQACNPRLAAFVSVVFLLTATSTHAGFEWLPKKPEATPAPKVETAPMEPRTQDLLSHESGSLSADTTDETLLPPPLLETEKTDVPASHEAQGTPEPVVETKSMMPPQEERVPEPVIQESASVPPPMEPVANTRLVVPEDAPQNAIEATQKNEAIKINAVPMDAEAEAAEPQETTYSNVVGFGSDIPLALALRQIVPPEYGFSFGKGVNPGIRISWNGGKSWPEVVNDMISPLGLRARIQGNAVAIYSEEHSSITPLETAPKEPAEPIQITKIENAPEIQRQTIQDPGPEAQAQEEATLKMIEQSTSKEPAMQQTERTEQPEALKAEGMHSTVIARKKIWEASEGASLKQTLTKWSKEGNLDLTWNAAHDYTLESDILVAGDIQQAIKAMLRAGIDAETGPSMTFTNTAQGGKLVVNDAGETRS